MGRAAAPGSNDKRTPLSASATIVGQSRPVLIASSLSSTYSFTLQSEGNLPWLFPVSVTNIGTAPTTFSILRTSLKGIVALGCQCLTNGVGDFFCATGSLVCAGVNCIACGATNELPCN